MVAGMRKLFCLIIAATTIGVFALRDATSENGATAAVAAKIEGALPKSWIVVERRPDTLPQGHYWGQEYSGIRGDEILIQGGADVHVSWRDTKGEWHTEAVGREALKLYVMPSSYRESLRRFFIPKRPAAASLLFEGQTFKVYAYPSFRILEKERLDWIVKHGNAIRWPDSPENNHTLSWRNWADEIPQMLKGM